MVLWDYRDAFLSGLGVTLQLTVVAFVGAALLGTLMAAFRISPIAPLRGVGLVFVEVFRNVPLMSLMIVVVYALPEIGITMSLTSESTIFPKAPPMITPTARSTTLPFRAKSRKSDIIDMANSTVIRTASGAASSVAWMCQSNAS